MCANFSIWLCFLLEEIHSEHLAGDLAVICSARGHFTFRAASSRLHFKVHRAGLCGYSFCSGFWRYDDHTLPAPGSLNAATGSFSSLQHIFLLSLFLGFIFTNFSHSHLPLGISYVIVFAAISSVIWSSLIIPYLDITCVFHLILDCLKHLGFVSQQIKLSLETFAIYFVKYLSNPHSSILLEIKMHWYP